MKTGETDMRHALPTTLISSLLVLQPAIAADTPTIKQPFKADLITTNLSDNDVLSKSKVLMTRKGTRIETLPQPGGSPHIIYIQNFSTSESWMLAPKDKRVTKMMDDGQGGDMDDMEGGIMSTEPCMGTAKKPQPAREWNGQQVEAWACSRDGAVYAYQLFSTKYGIVVSEERPEGERDELVNLSPANDSEGIFTPPSDYRSVPLQEFFTGAPQLQNFDSGL